MANPDYPTSTLAYALMYAACGLRVLPIKPGTKRPPMREWVDAATNDEALIRNWFTEPLYRDHGIGLAMGRQPNGLFIFALDVDEHDPAHSGSETLADLEAKHGALPDTVRSLTGSSGLHLLYALPESSTAEVRNGWAGDGLDVRGEGGQIVVAPSVHPVTGTMYAWEHGFAPWEHAVAEAPQWLLDIAILTAYAAPVLPPPPRPTFANPEPDSPAEWLRGKWDWPLQLEEAGWQLRRSDRNGDTYWTRPGKDPRDGESAVLHPGGPFIIWSTDSTVHTYRAIGHQNRDGSVSLSPFEFYAARRHNGDMSAAAHAVRALMDPDRHLSAPTAPTVPSVHRRLRATPTSQIDMRRTRWLWDQRIPIGALSLLAGPEGLGKSTLAYWLAARVTRGELDGEDAGIGRSVLVCATEDSWSQTIAPRLYAHDANLDRVFRLDAEIDGAILGELSLPADLLDVIDLTAEHDASLLILDPLMSRLDAHLDSHRDAEVRLALEPLVRTCERAKLACLGLIHHNKSGSTNPLDLVMASKAFTAVARSVHTVIRDPDDDDVRLFGMIKNNLGRGDLPVRTFTIQSWLYPTVDEYGNPDGMGSVGRLEWGVDSMTSIQSAVSNAANPKDNAETWLRDYMRHHGPRVFSGDVFTAADKEGIPRRSLTRARQRLGIDSEDVGSIGRGRQTYWFDPADSRLSTAPPPDDTKEKPW